MVAFTDDGLDSEDGWTRERERESTGEERKHRHVPDHLEVSLLFFTSSSTTRLKWSKSSYTTPPKPGVVDFLDVGQKVKIFCPVSGA